ncbi:MAG TPA: amidohydrolase family protein [Alphaproteobacteria bacterium]|jgi:imidazolonepropionase-like amidohydrolase|nr:amidohydrolase family protein [Alphaproteobacteria bacterium]MDP6271912.1 amidohydrolase family protein [Alphaproteobacteria bacterium]MDP7429069.1 amidohydrolase family protein [Alphaproteobacteria bacterium]HJM48406.1 amidohydrolase family protein [Alphaproteobacteria bacterium]
MSTLFAGGLVFDGSGTLLDDHGVMIAEGRVQRLAPLAEFEGFAGERVDTTGATLMPGLFDCHVHLCFGGEPDPFKTLTELSDGAVALKVLDNAQKALRGGVTALRDCGGKDYLEFAARDACNAGTFAGPTIRASGRVICMTGGHGNRIGRVADGVDEVVKAAREQIHAGCDLVKIMATGGVMTPGVNPEDAHYSAEEMAAGISEAQRFHKPTATHAQGRDGILNAVRGGISSVEHGIYLDERCVEEMVERGTYLVATLGAINNILVNTDQGIPDYAIEKSQRVAEIHRQAIRLFYKAGGKLAAGTDAGTPFNLHGDNARELGYLVDVGVSPSDALVAATGNAAALNRIEDEGRIAEGNRADLLLVAGNPVADIQAAADKANHRAVIKRGNVVAGSLDAQ